MDALDQREPRKQVRIERRRDLVVVPEHFEGRTHYVIKDPIRLTYHRLQEAEHFLFALLDGEHTLEEVRQEFERHYRPRRLTLPEVEAFARQLVRAGLAHSPSAGSGREMHARWLQGRLPGFVQRFSNLLAIKLPLLDPDRFLRRLLPSFGWLFTPTAFAFGLLTFLTALLLLATQFDGFLARLPAARDYFSAATIFQLWLAIGVVKVCHELGHGLSCQKFGGHVPEMGLMFLCFVPCLYCNVSDAWTLPSKWRRMAIGLAGVYIELLIASLATFVWWSSANGVFVHQLSLNLMVVCSVNTVLINGNPLLRYDGYHVLADWLEMPNLHEQSRRVAWHAMLRVLLGVPVPAGPELSLARLAGLSAFAIGSVVYRWIVTATVFGLMFHFLKPYRLESLAMTLALLTLFGAALQPILQVMRAWRDGGAMPPMLLPRVLASSAGLLALVACFFLLPLPLAPIRQTGLIDVRPDALAPVFLTTGGTLRRLCVRPGQHVEAGDLLAEFDNLELDNDQAAALAEVDNLELQRLALRASAAGQRDTAELARTEANLARLAAESAAAARQVELLEQKRRRLQLLAPRAGVVMGLPPADQVGKGWTAGPDVPFCRIGDLGQLWALVPLAPADYRLLQEDLTKTGPQHLAAVRLGGRPGSGWDGDVTQLPEAEAQEVPLALTRKAGGPLLARPATSSNFAVPEQPQYLVGINFHDPEGVAAPGCLAQVVVRGQRHAAAWWLWRGLCASFDLRLR